MAYDQDEIFEQAKEAITEHSLYFVEDVVAYIPCCRETFYQFFPIDSDKSDTLKGLLEVNKIQTKVDIRKKLKKGEKAAELLALYRLICTPEERQSLNQSYIDHTSKGNEFNSATIIIQSEGKEPKIE